jgi:hypothetical protein
MQLPEALQAQCLSSIKCFLPWLECLPEVWESHVVATSSVKNVSFLTGHHTKHYLLKDTSASLLPTPVDTPHNPLVHTLGLLIFINQSDTKLYFSYNNV